MALPLYEKFVNYGGTRAHFRIPENPTGLVFVAPGAQVKTSDPLILAITEACEAKGQAVVLADLGQVALNVDDPYNVHGNFSNALQSVIDGYRADNDYMPEAFELIGHSMGGAAVLTLVGNNPVSRITVLDPAPVDSEVLKAVECPAHFILSNVRSFRGAGERMFNQLVEQTDIPHALHKVDTSKVRDEGHYFRGKTAGVKAVIRSNGGSEPDLIPDIEPKGFE